MEGREKVDRIEIAIQQLMDEQKEMTPDDHSLHLSNLISQLETLKGDGKFQQLEPPANANDGINEDDERRAIVKELREIKRQNFITQCLVSALVVITLAWQLSEVSLILKVKDRISHPFRSFVTMLKGGLKGPNLNIVQNGDKQNSSGQHENEGTLVPPIKIPVGLDNDEKC